MTIPFDINIFIYYLILEEFHGVLEMGFMQEEHGSILVEVVDLDRATLIDVEEFKKLLFQDIQTGWRKIIIDISQCEFIDSTFLGMIVVALKKISELGGKLRLVGIVSPTPLKIIFTMAKTMTEKIKFLFYNTL